MVEKGPEAVEQNSTTRTPDKGRRAAEEEVMESMEWNGANVAFFERFGRYWKLEEILFISNINNKCSIK